MKLENIKVKNCSLQDINLHESGELKGYIECLLYVDDYGYDTLFRVYDPDNGPENTLVSVKGYKCSNELFALIEQKLTETARPYIGKFRATQTFFDMLSTMDFMLDKDENGYCLDDLQGAYLGDIQSDRFDNAPLLIDRLDTYLNDYYFDDLEEAAEECEYFNERTIPTTAEEWADLYRQAPEGTEDFIRHYKHELDVMELIAYHADDVDLETVLKI